MVTLSLIEKYIWLFNVIERAGECGISLKEINEKWKLTEFSNGNELPRRTFASNLRAIESFFDVNIECNSQHKYYIDVENELGLDKTKRLFIDSVYLKSLAASYSGVKERIQIDISTLHNSELDIIVKAMSESKCLKMTYKPFDKEASNYHFDPYFVKFFLNRWYLIGKNRGDSFVRVLALDRMSKLEIMDEKFELPEDISPEEYFKDCYGIFNDHREKVQKIVLKFSKLESEYVRTLPIHSSQKEIETTENYSIFEYHMKIEYDLEQGIMWRMNEVEVLEPEVLRNRIKERIQIMHDTYFK